jgi:ribosome-associated protein
MRILRVDLLLAGGEIDFEFYRSSGPGGQNVNKVATAVRLRFDLRGSRILPLEVKERLARLAGRRLTEGGVLVIEAQRFRTQERNRRDALERLAALVETAQERPRARRATRPTAAAKERRLQSKKRRAAVKSARRPASEAQ